MSNYQIFWTKDFGFIFRKYSLTQTDLAHIYNWILRIGFIEVRKWKNQKATSEKVKDE